MKFNKKEKESNLTEEAGNASIKEKHSIIEMFGFKKKEEESSNSQRGLEIKLPGCNDFVPLGAWQYHKVYKDSLGKHLMIVVDEVAELLQPEGGKSAEAKEIAALQAEVETCLKSLTQLGRSSCISVVLATQRNDASVIPGIIQNNPLSLDTKIRVLRPVSKEKAQSIFSNDQSLLNEDTKERLHEFATSFGIDHNKDKGIIFSSESDKTDFYNRMQEDSDLYDKMNPKTEDPYTFTV